MPLYRRLPHRGFTNTSFKKEWQVVNLSQVEAKYAAGEIVDGPSLVAKRLVKRADVLVKVSRRRRGHESAHVPGRQGLRFRRRLRSRRPAVRSRRPPAARRLPAARKLTRAPNRARRADSSWRATRFIDIFRVKELRQRILYTFAWLALFRLGHVSCPCPESTRAPCNRISPPRTTLRAAGSPITWISSRAAPSRTSRSSCSASCPTSACRSSCSSCWSCRLSSRRSRRKTAARRRSRAGPGSAR